MYVCMYVCMCVCACVCVYNSIALLKRPPHTHLPPLHGAVHCASGISRSVRCIVCACVCLYVSYPYQHTHNTTQHNTTQHNTTQHNTTQHNTTQHNTTQRNTTQHNTTQHKQCMLCLLNAPRARLRRSFLEYR